MLLVAAMCAKVVVSVGGNDPGVDYRRLALAQLDFALNGRDEARSQLLLEQILAEARRQPGIESVSASTGLPFGIMAPSTHVTTEEQPFTETRDVGEYANRIAATPEILRTLGMQVVGGRTFTERDDAKAPRVAILSEGLSRRVFQTTDVVGRRVLLGPRSRLVKSAPAEVFAVVGVSKDTDTFMLGRRGNAVLFVPLAQSYNSAITISARTSDPSAAAGVLRSAIRKADPELAISSLGTGVKLLSGPYFLLRIVAALASALGVTRASARDGRPLRRARPRRQPPDTRDRHTHCDGCRSFAHLFADSSGRPATSPQGAWDWASASALSSESCCGRRSSPASAPLIPLTFMLVPVPFLLAALIACYVPASRASRVEPTVALRDL